MMSSMCSIPMDRRIVSGRMPAFTSSSSDSWRWVVEAGWMARDLGVPQIEQPLDELERVEEGQSRVVAPLGPEGDDGGHAPVQVALDQVVVGMVGEAGEAHPGHPGVGGQVVGHGPGVGLVALEPHGHRLEALQEQEGVEGREGGAAVAQLSRAGPHGEGPLGEVAGEDDAVEGGLGLVEHREAVGMVGPREPAAVHDGPTEGGAVAADELGQRVDDHVGPVLEGLEHERRGHRVVHDEGHAGRMGHRGHGLEVDDVAGRVADGLAEDGAGVLVDERGDRLGSVVDGEAGLDAQGGQHVGEVGEGGPVELRGHHEVRAGTGHRRGWRS